MKLRNTLIKTMAMIVVVFTVLSCDDEFGSVGTEIIGDVNFQDSLYAATPIVYSRKLDRVRADGLIREVQNGQPIFHASLLGVYDDPVYGQSLYSVLSQVQPAQFDPDFGTNAVLDRVVLNLPYFSTAGETKSVVVQVNGEDVTETETTYTLDSIYQKNPLKLSVFQSNYFLRSLKPGTNESEVYYSNDIETNFDSMVVEGKLLNKDKMNDFTFIPSAAEVVLISPDGDDADDLDDRTRVAPRLRLDLELDTFQTLFLDKSGSIELSNADRFNNYFRGIYIKTEPVNDTGTLLYVNLRDANITLHYTNDGDTVDDQGNPIRVENEFVLSFANTIINSIHTDLNPIIAEELKPENQNQVVGEENLYLKGGEVSYAVIDLFNRNVINENGEEENELDFIKRQNWLINDASLKFYINQDMVTAGETEPERLYIFNVETGTRIADYDLDGSFQLFNQNNPIISMLNHLGRISRGSDEAGEFYKIKMTQHLINILEGDIENVKLGLSVSQNVNSTVSVIGDTPTPDDDIAIPTSSIISHEGTVLYGNGASVPEEKRLKLEIFYTASKKN